jgi:glutathione S-transferase
MLKLHAFGAKCEQWESWTAHEQAQIIVHIRELEGVSAKAVLKNAQAQAQLDDLNKLHKRDAEELS